MTNLYGIDVSNDTPTLTPNTATAIKNAGAQFVMVGCQFPSNGSGNGHINLAMCAFHTLPCFPYFENTPVEDAWSYIGAVMSAPNVWQWGVIAVEPGSGFEDKPTIDAQLAALDNHKLRKIIYTSLSSLQTLNLAQYVNDWEAQDVSFIFADYQDPPQPDSVPGVTGPWFGHQYAGNQTYAGVSPVDLDVIVSVDPVIAPAPAVKNLDVAQAMVALAIAGTLAEEGDPISVTPVGEQETLTMTFPKSALVSAWPALASVLP